MSKIILINPPFNVAKENYESSISVGLLSIASFLKSKGVSVSIIDGARQKNYLDLIYKNISTVEFAGLSVMTTQIPNALAISRLIKEKNQDCKIIWGGSHPTFFPEETIKNSLIDVVVNGEGEEAMLDIVNQKKPQEIDGITFRNNGRAIVNKPRALHDPARMPLFDWELMPKEILNSLKIVPSLTSRGCPHRCTFCINAILDYRWRPRTVEQVLEDLQIIKTKEYFKNKPLRFWDENFFVDIKRAEAIIDGMIEKKIDLPWETTVRANYLKDGMIDDQFMAKLKKSGCYLLAFGAESGSEKILKKIQKNIIPAEIINSAKLCLKYDIIPQYSFMIGLPGEKKEDMKATLRLIDKLISLSDKVQILGPQAFRPYPGSPLFAECVKSGWRSPSSLEEWSNYVQNELSYLNIKDFPWVKDKDYVESMEAYVRFGAHSFKSAMGSSVKSQKMIKFLFVLICKLRWKLKFFFFPIEFKLAKKYVTK